MVRRLAIPVVLCVLFCSCDRLVWTRTPIVQKPDTSDFSLAGAWIQHDQVFPERDTKNGRILIDGPRTGGIYVITTSGDQGPVSTTFVASRVSENSEYALIEIDLAAVAGTPCRMQAYVTVKDNWLFVRRFSSQKLTDVLKREEVAAVIEHGGLFTEVSAESTALMRVLKTFPEEVTKDTMVYRRETLDASATPDNPAMNPSENGGRGLR